jgi:hypothetical protein
MLDPEPPAGFAKVPGAEGGAVVGEDARLVKTERGKQEGQIESPEVM